MQTEEYRIAWWRKVLTRPIMKMIFKLIFLLLAKVKITGRENIPRGKAYVVAINHVSTFDPPFAGFFWPEPREAMGAVEIWSRPGQNVLAHLWGGIKVHREDYDRELFETVDAVLQTGHPLLIAPEGGRSHVPGLRTAKPGIAFLVERAHVPVVPVAVIGTTDDFWKKASQGKRPLLEMHIGKPVNLPALQGSGETRRRLRQENADLVMRLIAGMLPEEYRGVYADSAILP